MLVITRKDGQSILIGEDTVITISKSRRGSTRVAIEAPQDTLILREELTRSTSTPPKK